MLRAIGYFFARGFKNISHHRLVSLAAAGIVTTSLLLFGIFLLMQMNLNALLIQVQEQCEINVYLKDDITDAGLLQVETDLTEISGVKEVRFLSKNERLEKVKETSYKGKEFLLEDFEDDNPLRDSYILTLTNLDLAEQVANEARKVSYVDEVTNMQDLANKIKRFADIAEKAGYLLMLLFAIAAIVIISNTIRMGMASRSQEISIMRSVGASGSYICGPFLVEGMILGLFGALVAAGLVLWGYSASINVIESLLDPSVFSTISLMDAAKVVVISFLGLGIGIGLIGSGLSVHRYKN